MKRLALPLACILPLAACSVPQMAAVGTRASLSPETVGTITAICRHGEPLVSAALNPVTPSWAREIGVFVRAYCSQMLAGQVPLTTDGNTVNWLRQNLDGLARSL